MTNLLMDFGKSKKKGKKYEITFLIDGKKKTFNFGSNVSITFVEGATIEKRNNYLKRHSVNEDWNEINPGSLSAGILWGDSNDINENLKDYMKLFNIKESVIQGGATPKNKVLYEKVKNMMDEIYEKPSAYKSGAIVKKYKELGGEYIEDNKPKNLARWFKEDWQNIASKDAYPVLRPTKIINNKTPLTVKEIPINELIKQVKLKQVIKGDKNLPKFKSK
jgi:hypothetical protein